MLVPIRMGTNMPAGNQQLRSNSLCSSERKLFYSSIPVIMRHARNMVGCASGSKCSLIFYIFFYNKLINIFLQYHISIFYKKIIRLAFTMSHRSKLGVYNIVSFLCCCFVFILSLFTDLFIYLLYQK